MSRSRSRRRTIHAGICGGLVLLTAAAVYVNGSERTCSAVGYANIGPVQLRFDTSLEVDDVSACFGSGCQPVSLVSTGSDWSVPQSAEYLQAVEAGSITDVAVLASSRGEVVAERTVEAGIEMERGFGWPQCPGPYHYLPVVIAP